eukprot:g11272.t1
MRRGSFSVRSVKGRHADDNNSLRCGTCGSESHEAFCPICRQWDSYPGSKGESTLACKSPRCRGRQEGETTKFFQVYCETCVCWRSVLGEKDSVGRASIRCEGCKSDLRGTTCPACGNWDQLVRRPHQHHYHPGFRRKTRFHEKRQPRLDGSDFGAADAREKEGGGNLLLARPRPMCTSCGHQPPESPDDEDSPDDTFPSNSSNISFSGVVHEDADEAAATATASTGPTVSLAAAATTLLADQGSSGDRVVRNRRVSQRGKTEIPPPLETEDGRKLGEIQAPVAAARDSEESAEGGDERQTPPDAFPSAPIDGLRANPRSDSHDPGSSRREKPRADDSQAENNLSRNDKTAVKESSNRHGNKCQAGRGISSTASGNSTTDGAADGGDGKEQPQVVSEPGVPTGIVRGDGEALLPVAPAPSAEGNDVSRAVKPPPRSTLRRRGGRRPFVPRHPSPTISPSLAASAAERAEAELAGVETRMTSKIEAAKEGGRGAGEGGEAATVPVPVLVRPTSAEESADEASPRTPAETHGASRTAASRRRTERDRPASRNRGAGRRRRQKHLGSSSSSSLPSPQSLPSSTPATGPPLPGTTKSRTISVSDDHPSAPSTPNPAVDDDDVAAGCGVTFAAVARESSPPPPPGIRVGGKAETEAESGGPGCRSGAKDVVHLAFCSRCQEYQSWRAPLTSAGRRLSKETAVSSGGGSGSPSPRRHCTECGDLYSNISYYPAT